MRKTTKEYLAVADQIKDLGFKYTASKSRKDKGLYLVFKKGDNVLNLYNTTMELTNKFGYITYFGPNDDPSVLVSALDEDNFFDTYD